jgi:hypothetical protein
VREQTIRTIFLSLGGQVETNSIAYKKCNEIWEPIMAKIMCPLAYKSFSQEGIEYVKRELKYIKSRDLYLELSGMIFDCEEITGDR